MAAASLPAGGDSSWLTQVQRTIEASEHDIRPSGDGIVSSNRAQDLRFDHAVVLVEPTRPWSFDRLKPSESARHLVRHVHLPRSLGVTGESGTHLERASRLAATVPTYQLNRGEGRADLARSTRRLANLVAGGEYS